MEAIAVIPGEESKARVDGTRRLSVLFMFPIQLKIIVTNEFMHRR